jgi:hypothetical protein
VPPANVVPEYFLLQQTQAIDFTIQKTAANSSATATLYLSVIQGSLGRFDVSPHNPAVVIRQYRNPSDVRFSDLGALSGGTFVANDTSHSALTTNDKTFLLSNTVQSWFASIPTTTLNKAYNNSSDRVTGSFKIVWNYNPNNGRHVVVEVSSNSVDGSGVKWKAVLAVPIDNTQVGCLVDTPTTQSVIPPPQIIRITGCMNGWQSAAMDLDDLAGNELSVFDKLTDFEGSGTAGHEFFVIQSGGVPQTQRRR